jgi:hypothetical protein
MGDLTTLAHLKAWLNLGQERESAVIPAAPGPFVITVAKAAGWNGDGGVIFKATGALLAPVAGAPGAGQYSVASGVYTCNAGDAAKEVEIAYSINTADDALLARLVSAASAAILGEIERDIFSQNYTEIRDGHGGQRLVLKNTPVTAVASVKVDGVSIPPAATGINTGYRFTTTAVTLNGYSFTRGLGNVEIAYTAGYAAAPQDLEQICIDLAALLYKERGRIGLESESLGESTTTYVKDIPEKIRKALRGWKRVVPV